MHKDVLKTSRKSIHEKSNTVDESAADMINKLKTYELTLPDQEMSSSFSSIGSDEVNAVTNDPFEMAPN